jgi:hypothetical protein
MSLGRLGLLGLLIVLAGTATGCTGFADAGSEARPAGVAVPSYGLAPGTPAYCTSLAGSTHLTGIPAAVGVLSGRRGDVQAELDLAAAIDDLRAVLEAIEDDGGSPPLEAAVGELVAALSAARDGSMTSAVRDDISTALDDVGRLVQPVCRFPS